MSSYVKTSFDIEAPARELDLLKEGIDLMTAMENNNDHPISSALRSAFESLAEGSGDDHLKDIFQSTGGCSLQVSTERSSEDVLSIHGLENVEIVALAEIIRATCPSALPFAFSFSTSDDRPHADAFGGGVVIIHREHVEIRNTTEMLVHFERLKNEGPLNDLQRSALEAYDDGAEDATVVVGDLGYEGVKDLLTQNVHADPLLVFVLGEVGGAADAEEAAEMIQSGIRQLQNVAAALDRIADRTEGAVS